MIFFDFDGVLVDSNQVWLQVDYDFTAKRGLTITEEYTRAVTHSIFPLAAQFTRDYYHLPDTPEEIMAEWRSMAYDAYAHTIPLKPGALELLKKLHAQGEPMALLTAGFPALTQAAVDRHGLGRYLQGIFFAHEVGMEKKNPAIYRMAAEQYGLSPAQCTLYEDAPHNCAAAKEAGFMVVGVYDDFYQNTWEDVVKNSHQAVRSLMELL